MDELLVSEESIPEENMKIFEQIKALTKDKDKYTMKDVNTICELLGIKIFWYQKLVFLHHLNDKDYMRYICQQEMKTLIFIVILSFSF